jgi:hypothetical protein
MAVNIAAKATSSGSQAPMMALINQYLDIKARHLL